MDFKTWLYQSNSFRPMFLVFLIALAIWVILIIGISPLWTVGIMLALGAVSSIIFGWELRNAARRRIEEEDLEARREIQDMVDSAGEKHDRNSKM